MSAPMTGPALRRHRRALGLTQVGLAARLGVRGNTVARWERGDLPIRPPMARLIRLIALASAGAGRR
jgi:DNA-binding transcriptional regulator YiaG